MKSAETATSVTPYILIVELVFCGMLFELKGVLSKISYGMISRWGMEALGTTSDLNCLPLKDPEAEDKNGDAANGSTAADAPDDAGDVSGAGDAGVNIPTDSPDVDGPSALAAAQPELPDDLSYCPAGMKDDMLAGGGFTYSDDYLHNDWHIAKAWIILGCSAVALFIVADLLVHRFKNTNNLGRE